MLIGHALSPSGILWTYGTVVRCALLWTQCSEVKNLRSFTSIIQCALMSRCLRMRKNFTEVNYPCVFFEMWNWKQNAARMLTQVTPCALTIQKGIHFWCSEFITILHYVTCETPMSQKGLVLYSIWYSLQVFESCRRFLGFFLCNWIAVLIYHGGNVSGEENRLN